MQFSGVMENPYLTWNPKIRAQVWLGLDHIRIQGFPVLDLKTANTDFPVRISKVFGFLHTTWTAIFVILSWGHRWWYMWQEFPICNHRVMEHSGLLRRDPKDILIVLVSTLYPSLFQPEITKNIVKKNNNRPTTTTVSLEK